MKSGKKRFPTSTVRGRRYADSLAPTTTASCVAKKVLASKPEDRRPKAEKAMLQDRVRPSSSRIRVTPVVRSCAKQAHTRMTFDKLEIVPLSVSRPLLVAASVKAQTMIQYDSRLRTLCRFLDAARKCTGSDVLACTKEEFFCFLHNWKLQKKGSAGPTRSALVKLHDIHGIVPSFLRDRDTVLAVEGAGRDCPRVDKAVLDSKQRDAFLDAVLHAPEKALGACTWCKKFGTPLHFRLRLQIEAEFLWEVPVRLTDAGHLKVMHFNEKAKPKCVFVEGLKTSHNGGHVIVNDDGWELFLAAAALTQNEWIFPKCGTQHLGAILQWCQAEFSWEPGLAWVAYSMRHTGMNAREKKVAAAVSELVHNVTRPVSKGYARTNAQRRKKEKI